MPSAFAAQSTDAAAPESVGPDTSTSAPSQGPIVKPDDVAQRTQPAIMLEAFINVVGRLERTLDLETELLKQHRPIALHDFNHKKSHGILELSRAMDAMRAFDHSAFDFDANAPLARLRVSLENNLAILQTHLNAVAEIAAIIARAIQDHESDGTYTSGVNVKGRRR